EDDDSTVWQADSLPQMTEQHHAAERCGQRGHEEPVVAARDRAGDCSGRVASQAVSDEPLRLQEPRLVDVLRGPDQTPDELSLRSDITMSTHTATSVRRAHGAHAYA